MSPNDIWEPNERQPPYETNTGFSSEELYYEEWTVNKRNKDKDMPKQGNKQLLQSKIEVGGWWLPVWANVIILV